MNSTSVGSNTVRRVQPWWIFEDIGGKIPLTRTSFQPGRTLQMSIQSKYFKTSSNAIQNTPSSSPWAKKMASIYKLCITITTKWIWDSSIFSSIKPKLDMTLFVDFCVFTCFYQFLHDVLIKLFCFDLQNNFMIRSCKNW